MSRRVGPEPASELIDDDFRPAPKSKPDDKGKPDGDKAQIWLLDPTGGEPWPLTEFPRGVALYDWAGPDALVFTAQEETTLYEATRHEISTYAAKRELMSGEGTLGPDGGGFLSVLDIERRSHELLVQSFHLFDENQMVIKTQAIIEVSKNAE